MREKRPPRTAWELPGLINRGAVRSPRQPTVGMQPWYANVVAYTHLSRFVTGSILRRRFPLWLTSDRTAQRHLANLVDRGLLATVSAWATGPNFPHVYQATPSGVRFVKGAFGDRIRIDETDAEEKRTRGHGLHSLLHELFISELTLELTAAIGERDDLELLDLERRYHRQDRRLTYREDCDQSCLLRLLPCGSRRIVEREPRPKNTQGGQEAIPPICRQRGFGG